MKDEEERSFPNWDCVEVRERYYKKKEGSESMEKEEAAEAMKAATRAFVNAYCKKTIREFVEAMEAALNAGLTGGELDEIIATTAREERKKREAKNE